MSGSGSAARDRNDIYDDGTSKYYERILDILQTKFRNTLIFAGIVQDGKLLDHRRGQRGEFALSPPNQDALDVKLSLVLDVTKTLEQLIGSPRILTMQFQSYDLAVMSISPRKFIYTLSIPGSGNVLAQLLVTVSL